MPGEPMACKTIKNSTLNFLFRKKHFSTPGLGRLFCNTLTQPYFDYACSAWYPNLNKKLKNKIPRKLPRMCSILPES